ncbi:hypothetical protein QP185_06545 [Sphingomonas aerolata]
MMVAQTLLAIVAVYVLAILWRGGRSALACQHDQGAALQSV